mgnify:CR=1 FL=1
MRNIILHDIPEAYSGLLPLTFTRPIAELHIGFGTIRSKWERMLPGRYSYSTATYLAELFPQESATADSLVIAANVIPTPALAEAAAALTTGAMLATADGTPIAMNGFKDPAQARGTVVWNGPAPVVIRRPYDLFLNNAEAIAADFAAFAKPGLSAPVSSTCTVIGDPSQVFIHPEAVVEGATLNTKGGPIYIDRGAEVMEGSCLRGPIYIGEHSNVNMGTRIYGATTIATHCKVGGEINNVVMHPYSNKAHDGFLGNAVIGSWCNLGAGCVASNLKNDYTAMKLWDYTSRRFLRTGLQFCGLIMGDHSKAGINTMFNTATVVGIGVNIHGTGFPRNFVASFSEGSAGTGFTDVPLVKFFAIAERVMARRDITLTEPMRRLFTELHTLTECYK